MIIDGGELSSWSVFIMAPLSVVWRLLFGLGGFIEIREAGGDESKREKRRNISCFLLYECF